MRGAEAAAHGIAEDLREGEEVLRALALNPGEALMGDETAHLKRQADARETRSNPKRRGRTRDRK